MSGRAVSLVVATLVAACHPAPVNDRNRVDRDDAIIYVSGPVVDAALWIDGVYAGELGDLARGIAIEPGRHRLELHRDGYFSHYQDLDLAPAQRLRFAVELAPILP